MSNSPACVTECCISECKTLDFHCWVVDTNNLQEEKGNILLLFLFISGFVQLFIYITDRTSLWGFYYYFYFYSQRLGNFIILVICQDLKRKGFCPIRLFQASVQFFCMLLKI